MPPPKPSYAPASTPDLRILGNEVTLQPGGYETAEPKPEQNLVEHMARFRQSPLDFMREISLYVSGTGWRAYDNVIGQPVYYNGFSEDMIERVMEVPMLKNKIRELARKRAAVEEREGLFGAAEGSTSRQDQAATGPNPIVQEAVTQNSKEQDLATCRRKRRDIREQELVTSLTEVAYDVVDNMICKMDSKPFIRGAYYFATQLLTRAYHQGIHVSSEEVLRLRAVAQAAAEKKQSIVFLPCHKSHVDYVSLQLICYRLGIALPTVVAGENLGIVGLKQFLQRAGAMWIRRSFAGDALYGVVVQAYIESLLRCGYHLEAFIEGGRSRTGKLLPPKFGILSYVLDAVASGRVDDAIICPVSTQYDKVIETESYISELLGQPKRKENVVDLLSASSVLSLKLGRVDVRFHEPWSLKEFLREQQGRMKISYGLEHIAGDVRVRMLRTLGYRVLSDINEVSVVMPTALVGTVLLTLRGRGVGKSELIRRVDWLSDRVRAKGGRVAHFHGLTTMVVVERALEVLGLGLVGRVDGLAEETYHAVDRFQLSFYRNMTIHLFISEALVAVSMYSNIKQGGGSVIQRIGYDELYQQVEFLSRLFQGEFIYPTEGLPSNLKKTIDDLVRNDTIKIARNSQDEIEMLDLADGERYRGRENYDFYCFLLWPYVEAAWLAAVSLMALVPPQGWTPADSAPVTLARMQTTAQWLGKTLYHQGDLSYYEAVNKESLKNAFERFVDDGLLMLHKPTTDSSSAAPICAIAPDWLPRRSGDDGHIIPEGRLWDFTEKIAKSRREGKNRRDGATVSRRVLALAEAVGKELYKSLNEESQGGERKGAKRSKKTANKQQKLANSRARL